MHSSGWQVNDDSEINYNLKGTQWINTLRPRQNGRHFPDHIFQCKISLKFVPKGPINNIPTLVQIMAWHRPGNKPLSEPMMVILLTHICATLPQWVKQFSETQTILYKFKQKSVRTLQVQWNMLWKMRKIYAIVSMFIPSLWLDFNTTYNCYLELLTHTDGLVQERCNSSALAMELLLSCTNPSIWWWQPIPFLWYPQVVHSIVQSMLYIIRHQLEDNMIVK